MDVDTLSLNTDIGLIETGCWSDLLSFAESRKLDMQVSMKIQGTDDPKHP
jgi:hypothetical protein